MFMKQPSVYILHPCLDTFPDGKLCENQEKQEELKW